MSALRRGATRGGRNGEGKTRHLLGKTRENKEDGRCCVRPRCCIDVHRESQSQGRSLLRRETSGEILTSTETSLRNTKASGYSLARVSPRCVPTCYQKCTRFAFPNYVSSRDFLVSSKFISLCRSMWKTSNKWSVRATRRRVELRYAGHSERFVRTLNWCIVRDCSRLCHFFHRYCPLVGSLGKFKADLSPSRSLEGSKSWWSTCYLLCIKIFHNYVL